MRKANWVAVPLVLALASCGVFKTKVKPTTVGERVPVLDFETKVEAEGELADLKVTLPPPEVNADWAQPGGSPSKAMGHLAVGDTLSQAWSVSIGKGSSSTVRLNAAPIVFGGMVYAVDTTGTVRSFDATTGAAGWSAAMTVKGQEQHAAFGGGVSAGDGRVYVISGFGIAAAFDAKTGAEIWRKTLGTPFRGAPTVANGRIYALTQDNQLYALSADKGETVWNVAGTVEVAGLLGTAAPAFAQDTLVVGYSSGELNALRAENGRTVWADALARSGRTTALNALTDIDASPVIDRGRVFAIGHGGRMAAIELSTGQRVWERNFAGTSTPWVVGDFVYAVTLDGEVVCMTRGDGKIKWVQRLQRYTNIKKKTGAVEWSGPVLASDRLLVSGSNRELVTLSPYTGKPISTVKLKAAAFLPPVVAGKTVYLLTDDGKLTAYR
ncbi:PQQ-binding-like beta-propeller repeat protein [Glacieibacterium sp.]|uniref:outer membrane protein assembly factor BamB family protein n=1 Tax=Glacieibacterium sp. TaxID=2860237 RepID=UPI003AFF84C2